MSIDEAKLEEFIGKFAGDFGVALHASTVVLGDKLGLYRALAQRGPSEAADLAGATGCDERLVQEWLNAQFAAGYCHFSAATGRYWLSPEQAAVLAEPSTPAFLVGAMTIAVSTAKDEDKVRSAFLDGGGLGWHEHHRDLFGGTERLFRPAYVANLVSSWIPSLDGVDDRLRAGATVADLGCGHGASSIVLAEAYPDVRVMGYDSHAGSIYIARKRAEEAGVADRVTFEVAAAQDFPGDGYDLVCVFDALHDMGDPVGAARHIRSSLAAEGTWLLVEPMAGDSLEENANPVGRIFYSASTCICTPTALSQEGGCAWGAQASDATIGEAVAEAGFTRFRRAAETPFNRVFEVRP